MSKIFDKFIKKKEVIHDGGVHQKANPVDFIVILGCIIIVVGLCYLSVMAYITPAY